jgi:long-chain acyl-CoA synthetase
VLHDPKQLAAERPHEPRSAAEQPTLFTLLLRNAEADGGRIAMRERDLGIWREYTWSSYLKEVTEAAAGLDELGFKAGDPLLVLGDNRARLYFAMTAAAALGGYAVPLYPETPAGELSHLIKPGMQLAIAEDQEQVDKLIEVRSKLGFPSIIVYDDPRGIAAYAENGLLAYDALRGKGAHKLRTEPNWSSAFRARAKADDWAVLLYSSGTTGKPKGIPLKNKHLIAAVRQAAEAGYFREGDSIMGYLPMAWVGDYTFSVAASLALRLTVNIPERQETAMHDIREAAPTMFFASARSWDNFLTRLQVRISESTPLKRALVRHFTSFAMNVEKRQLAGKRSGPLSKLWRELGEVLVYGPIKDHLGLSRVERCYTAGESVGEDTFLYFRGLGLKLKQFYGQSESCALTAAQDDDSVRLHTVGRALPGIGIRVDESGEILLRGANIFDGYDGDPEATANALAGGWFRTGDAGYLEPDGQLVVLGRVSELQFTASQERFIPTFIENRIKFSPYIRDVAVIGAGRPYLTALACIDVEAAGHWAQVQGIGYTSYADLSQKPQVLNLVRGIIAHTNEVLPEGLKIKRFANLPKEFDPDDGEVTRTRKLRRNVIDRNYEAVIAALYAAAETVSVEVPVVYETGERGTLKRPVALVAVGA